MIIALVSETNLVKPSELYKLKPALELQAAHVCHAYTDHPPAIDVFDSVDKLPRGCFPLVFVEGGLEGTLGEHWHNPNFNPAGRVFVEQASGMNKGTKSLSETASHEIAEMIVNPTLRVWYPYPGRSGVFVANEPADMCQDTYPIHIGNTDWYVSNFVTPFWFMERYLDDRQVVQFESVYSYGMDWCKRIPRAGKIRPSGYAVLRENDGQGGWRRWLEDQSGPLSSHSVKLDGKNHAASRTFRLNYLA